MEKIIKEYYTKLLTTNLEKSENNNFLTKLNYQRWSRKTAMINYYRRDCQKIKDFPLKTVPETDVLITNFYLTIFWKVFHILWWKYLIG